MIAWQVVALGWAALGQACAVADGDLRVRLTVAPAVWVTEPPPATTPLEATVRDAIVDRGIAADVLTTPLDVPCSEDNACLARFGREGGAEKLVVMRLAGLGPTTLLRLQSVDIGLGAMEHTLQAVVEDTTPERVSDAASNAARKLADLYRPITPWYRRPTTIVAGAVVAAAAIVTIIVVSASRDPKPDAVIRPP